MGRRFLITHIPMTKTFRLKSCLWIILLRIRRTFPLHLSKALFPQKEGSVDEAGLHTPGVNVYKVQWRAIIFSFTLLWRCLCCHMTLVWVRWLFPGHMCVHESCVCTQRDTAVYTHLAAITSHGNNPTLQPASQRSSRSFSVNLGKACCE